MTLTPEEEGMVDQFMLEWGFLTEEWRNFMEGLDVKFIETCHRDIGKSEIKMLLIDIIVGESANDPEFMSAALSCILSKLPKAEYIVQTSESMIEDDEE